MAELSYVINVSVFELFRNFHRLPEDQQAKAFQAFIDAIVEQFAATGTVPSKIEGCQIVMVSNDPIDANAAMAAFGPEPEKMQKYKITWKVNSYSRPDVVHTVSYDLETREYACTCEQFQYRGSICKHVAMFSAFGIHPSGIEVS